MPRLKKKPPQRRIRGPSDNKKRDPFIHSALWGKARKRKLYDTPICEVHEYIGALIDCVTGHPVDHIIPRHRGGAKTDGRNLMTLCKECHITKTSLEVHHNIVDPSPLSSYGHFFPTDEGRQTLIKKLAEFL